MSGEEGVPAGAPRAIDLLLTGGTVITMDRRRQIVRDGAVAIHGPTIIDVGSTSQIAPRYAAARQIDLRGAVLQPGFVDCHVHLSHHLARGTVPDGWPENREHDQWLPYWLNMTEEDAYLSALIACLEMAHNGTTTFCDMSGRYQADLEARAVREVGLRGAISEVCWDRPPHASVSIGTTADAIGRLARLLERFPRHAGSLVWAGVNLSAMGKATDALLVAARRLATEHGVAMTMHQSFAAEDVEAYRRDTGTSAVEHLRDLGILGPGLALVHMIHAEEAEVAILAETGTNVVHCPAASTRRGMGASRVGRFPEMLSAGVNVALGSDSANYSDSFDIGRQAYLAATIHREARGTMPTISGETALEMATLNGARALGLDAEIGSIEPGKRADLVIHRRDRPEWHPALDVVSSLIYSASSGGVDSVIVEGRVIVEGGRSTLVDEEAAFGRIDAAARALYSRMGWTSFDRWPVS